MTTLHVQPQRRFLRVVRTLALVSTIATPVVVTFTGIGCGGHLEDGARVSPEPDALVVDAGISTAPDTRPDTREIDTYPMGTSPPPTDSGHDADGVDVYDGTVVGVAPLDTGIDASDADAPDAEIGIGGPLRAPEMPDEGVA